MRWTMFRPMYEASLSNNVLVSVSVRGRMGITQQVQPSEYRIGYSYDRRGRPRPALLYLDIFVAGPVSRWCLRQNSLAPATSSHIGSGANCLRNRTLVVLALAVGASCIACRYCSRTAPGDSRCRYLRDFSKRTFVSVGRITRPPLPQHLVWLFPLVSLRNSHE